MSKRKKTSANPKKRSAIASAASATAKNEGEPTPPENDAEAAPRPEGVAPAEAEADRPSEPAHAPFAPAQAPSEPAQAPSEPAQAPSEPAQAPSKGTRASSKGTRASSKGAQPRPVAIAPPEAAEPVAGSSEGPPANETEHAVATHDDAPEPDVESDDSFLETEEFPSVASERPPHAAAQPAPFDDSEITETVVWAGSSSRDSSPDLSDDDDDAVVSSITSFHSRARALPDDLEVTVNLTADLLPMPERDDLPDPARIARMSDVIIVDAEDDPTHSLLPADPGATPPLAGSEVSEKHLLGLIEALVFASETPVRPGELARRTQAPAKEVKRLLAELRVLYQGRGIQLDEVGGAFVFRTNPVYAPFVRELTGQKPIKLTRTQVETLSILAYRQPITRPEIDDIRGVDSGPVLKMLLERDLIKILGKKDEPGRPILYGTTPQFLEFFGIVSLKDLPTLREFTELNDDSKRVIERELGETYDEIAASLADEASEVTATTELGQFEPPAEDDDAETPESRIDEALREIERAGEGLDDDESPVPAETLDAGEGPDDDADADDPLEDLLDDGPLDDDDADPDDDDADPGGDDAATDDDDAAPDDDGTSDEAKPDDDDPAEADADDADDR